MRPVEGEEGGAAASKELAIVVRFRFRFCRFVCCFYAAVWRFSGLSEGLVLAVGFQEDSRFSLGLRMFLTLSTDLVHRNILFGGARSVQTVFDASRLGQCLGIPLLILRLMI